MRNVQFFFFGNYGIYGKPREYTDAIFAPKNTKGDNKTQPFMAGEDMGAGKQVVSIRTQAVKLHKNFVHVEESLRVNKER